MARRATVPVPVLTSGDRTLVVPPGAVIQTGYVPMHRVRLGTAARIALGDLDAPYRRRLHLGDAQCWPPPVGHWETDPGDGAATFVVVDGRHDAVAALCAGIRSLFVAWLADGTGAP